MADGAAQPQRLEKFAAELVAKLRMLREEAFPPSEICGDLAAEINHRLGPVERQFLAMAFCEGLDDEEAARLLDHLTALVKKRLRTCEAMTKMTYKHAIAQALLEGKQGQAAKLRKGLEDFEARQRAEAA